MNKRLEELKNTEEGQVYMILFEMRIKIENGGRFEMEQCYKEGEWSQSEGR